MCGEYGHKDSRLDKSAHFAEKFVDMIAIMRPPVMMKSELHFIGTYLVLLKNKVVPNGHQRQQEFIVM